MSAPAPRDGTAREAPPLWRQLQLLARLIEGVGAGQSLTRLLDEVPPGLRAGAQALSFEVLRHWGTAQALRGRLAPRRPTPLADALLCSALVLLLPGCAQAYPAFTVVDQAVEAAKREPTLRRQAAFINACLRQFRRDADGLLAALADDPVARWNHPVWWIERLQADDPEHWAALLAVNQRPASMDLRVNVRRSDVTAYGEQLAQRGIAAMPLGGAALRLASPHPVHELPGFAEGLVSVQSATAQRAAHLLLDGLGAQPLRVLDACAAPGGKTAHLLELAPHAQVTALELNAERSRRIDQNLQRLGLQAQVRVADAGDPGAWWDGVPFDAILLDAPCSASGIVRRHPDVRWLRRASDIAQLAAAQDRLLQALWPLLAPGGRLLYCTCSVFRAEGAERIAAFAARNTDARQRPAPGHLLPLLPGTGAELGDNGRHDEDGFFYALLHKPAA
ncbi:16S rRNA (cytosine(967)-C(5))-methyltransferase RsmB [Ottowia pentelensis]|uniref:16S rRNA (Cytosine(967)-C(5))-methyltransferase RsmB n=1 Tax=Ottowia pentelensis TaxID=511108 RepID=A0ABV6PNL0_9BURK|nr:16S rRNA (cytosine(967)-C(5))-methyltransferase RsmB [Ottowia sp.]